MITAANQSIGRCFFTIALAASLLGGCSMLLPAKSPPPTLYSFENPQVEIQTASIPPAEMAAPTLIVSIPRAASGFDSHQIVYVRQAHTFEYFMQSQWVDTPASMLSPLMVSALESKGQFSSVIQSPTSAAGQLRLDVEIVRLQHEFLKKPSQVHFTLRAHILDTATRKVVAWREFDAIVPSPSEDPYGGVLAANRAVRIVVEELAVFCGQAARNFQKMQPKNTSGYKKATGDQRSSMTLLSYLKVPSPPGTGILDFSLNPSQWMIFPRPTNPGTGIGTSKATKEEFLQFDLPIFSS